MNTNPSEYLVIRIRPIFLYREFFGPMISTPKDCHHDAQRLYGKPGFKIKTINWKKASQSQKNLAKENKDNQ